MELLRSGIEFGLAISLLAGPILFTLVQTSVEQGFRAGCTVGAGIWTSDALFIASTWLGISYIAALSTWSGFEPLIGWVGGIILMAFGTAALVSKAPAEGQLEGRAVRQSSYLSLWLRGFVVNTANPFTFFFWIGVSSLLFTEKEVQVGEASLFYSGLMGTIIATDAFKIALAKFIRKWMRPAYIRWMRRIAGIALLAFGVVLILRVLKIVE
jgi:threonine/homoserine/homoserine lactone efflux protein